MKDGHTYEPYSEIYEYHATGSWGDGANPSSDGWEYSCYDPATGEEFRMEWCPGPGHFRSPAYDDRTSPQWYCQNRWEGYGMHPGRATQAVKSFLCPRDGKVSVVFSLGRNVNLCRNWSPVWRAWNTPCSARLYRNGVPLTEEVVMETVDPIFLTAECTVSAGDKISLRIDPMGSHVADGVVLYRQRVSYHNPLTQPNE